MITAISLIVCFIIALAVTPIIKRFAIKIGATDQPNDRKVHQKVMARIGGLAIFIAFIAGIFITQAHTHEFFYPILIGAFIITLTGFLDDLFELSAKWKLLGQIAAASAVVIGGVHVEFINLPFDMQWQLGWLSIPLTMIWIIGVTNAINLIDGLDGLAAGVSSIVLATITIVAIIDSNVFVMALGAVMLGSTLGFLVHNFNPAKIFMGDTGALFLGFMISVIALLGFKNITVFSLLIPVVMLAVPISDTLFAIIRRIVNKKPISIADKSHLHHCLLNLGYSHKQTVLIIYAMSALFGIAAIVLTMSTLWVTVLIVLALLILIELFAEKVGLVGKEFRPFMKFFTRIGDNITRR
ncbi:undecaprenyl-phosphate N-acetylglucosaminyl 1-phosphate transferase [Geomicrobium sp. JCM 19038]|nr:undecaprenyl-phosphate N-acetylglucosaminyl 1-phosphate transferase [Geomicrobium sp. JCM 19038]